MPGARRSPALIVVVLAAAIAGWGGAGVRAGVVGWPPSTLVVSEVQTGGASASDEFVEVANQGAAPVDLLGLEVVYATSTGSTVTRKATWAASLVLDPGKRVLLANASGVYAAVADVTYSGGFAATGGAIALRVVGGSVIDAIGWGDATNSFVEGVVAAAPPAGSSLERAPGGAAGNGTDTNQNSLDWFVQGVPSPQGSGGSGCACTRGVADAQSDRVSDADCEPDPESHARTDGDTQRDPDAKCYRYPDTESSSDATTHAEPDSDPDADADPHADAAPDGDPESNAHAEPDSDADTYADSDTDCSPHTDARPDADSDAEPDTDARSHADTGRRDSDLGCSRSRRRDCRDDRGRADDSARGARVQPRRVRPGRDGRDRAVPRRCRRR